MSEKLCTLRTKGGGGGKYTETSLWTNPSPSSSFAAQNVTLSQSIDNFKYIAIKFKYETSTSDTSYISDLMSVVDFKKHVKGTNVAETELSIAVSNATYYFIRVFEYVNATTIYIGSSYTLNNVATNNVRAIPLEILGLNELDHGKLVMDSGAFTVASGVTDTITCGFRPKKIYIYNLVGTTSMFVNIYDENVSSTYTIGAYRSSSSTNGCNSYALGGGNNGVIQSITDTGFTFKGSTVMSTLYYTAIG